MKVKIKIIIISLGLVFMILAILNLFGRRRLAEQYLSTPQEAKLSLTCPESYQSEQPFTLTLYLQSTTDVEGVDILINFDVQNFKLEKIIPSFLFSCYLPLKPENNVFDEKRVVDCANQGGGADSCNKGVINFGALAFNCKENQVTDKVSALEDKKIADLVFLPSGSGVDIFKAQIQYSPGETKDSNVAINLNNQAMDILTATNDCQVKIASAEEEGGQKAEDGQGNEISLENLNIEISFFGVPANGYDFNLPVSNRTKKLKVSFIPKDEINKKLELEQSFSYNVDRKTYEASFSFEPDEFKEGEYTLLVKGPGHLAQEFSYFNQGVAQDNISFSDSPFQPGEVNDDESIDTLDYSVIKRCKELDSRIGNESYETDCYLADGNFDGTVDNTDIDLFYNSFK